MRTLLMLLFLSCFGGLLKGNNYYFSSTSGDDNRSIAEAQNPATPWKTLEKLNALFSNLNAGDYVFLKRGDVFDGSIFISKSGNTNQPIVISAFGSGAKPVINGLLTLSNWTSTGSGIWEANSSSSVMINTLLVNGEAKAIGRYPNITAPNKGYLVPQSYNGNYQVIDNQLSSSDWTGGDVVIRKARWVIDRNLITQQSGNTLYYTSESFNQPAAKFGYFIQNHPKTLDVDGEWYYKVNEKRLGIYSSGNPSAALVQASTVNNLVTLTSFSNIVFDNLQFQGANNNALEIKYAQNIRLNACEFFFSGVNAVNALNTNDLIIENSVVDHTNNIALNIENCTNAIFRNNKITNTGMVAGMGKGDSGSYEAILASGNNHLIEGNEIVNTGYIPITFRGSLNTIRNNFIDNFALVKDDGGGIYSWNNTANAPANYGSKITGNIILNGKGAGEGTDTPEYLAANGIYMDDNTSHVEITGNTVANSGLYGIYLHNAYDILLENNTLFNNKTQLRMARDEFAPNSAIRNIRLQNNILFSAAFDQPVAEFQTSYNDIGEFGTFDNNYYARPTDDHLVINTFKWNSGNVTINAFSLETWKAEYNKDIASKKSPITVASPEGIRFEYNAAGTAKTFSLNEPYVDVTNKTYVGNVTLNPFSSLVLLKVSAAINDAIPPPDAGCATGTILREQWNNISGNEISSIPLETTASNRSQLTVLETVSMGEAYGARIRGYICAPVSGNYNFLIAGDDQAELWLSTDENPANKVKIASVPRWTDFHQWNKFVSQRSAPVSLQAGRRYYIEVLHKEGDGGDYVTVAWQFPNGALEIPVQGNRLSPYITGGSTPPPPTSPPSSACATGSILREQWDNVDGNDVPNIPLNSVAGSTSQLSTLETDNIGDRYGARIRGYVCPPIGGNYTFLIAGDDAVELWLSTNEDPANKVKIASLLSWTYFHEWNKYASQRSAPVYLNAGQRYYIEVLHKEGAGGDHVSVAWELPNGSTEMPIPGSRLSPYIPIAVSKADQTISFGALSSKTVGDPPFSLSAIASSGLAVSFRIVSGPAGISGNTITINGAGTVVVEASQQGDGKYNAATPVTQGFTVNAPASTGCATGSILREQWDNVVGNDVPNIPLSGPPTSTSQLTMLETTSIGDQYGARFRGYVCPPFTGNYTFRIAGDDAVELWLSTNENPANKTKIASLLSWTEFREWNKHASQRSVAISLRAGERYYIEVLHKEGAGGDHLTVAWELPNGAVEIPIPGSRLSPYLPANSGSNTQLKPGAADRKLEFEVTPNPLKTSATILISPARSGAVALEVYDLHGKLVQRLYSGTLYAGVPRRFVFKGDGLSHGVYVVRLLSGSKMVSRKVVFAK